MVVKKLLSLVTIGALVVGMVGCGAAKEAEATKAPVEEKAYEIGITQIVEHPALDASRNGFIDALKSKGYEDGQKVVLDTQIAQGDMGTNQLIASEFVNDKKDLIFAISTPSAQAAYNATKETPIMITAVTDAVEAKLVESNEKTGTNVAGTSDMSPIDKQIELAVQLLPDAKKIGVLYNTSEVNSGLQVEILKKVAAEKGLEVIEKGITATSEIPDGAGAIIGDVDFIYVPTDNLIASSLPIVVDIADKNGKAVIGSEDNHLKSGALATEGIDYYNLGFQTGLMAVEVLEGKEVSEMTVDTLKETKLIINKSKAEELGIEIPEDVLSKAELLD
jgi:putative ABC transport system substrate-binding protein